MFFLEKVRKMSGREIKDKYNYMKRAYNKNIYIYMRKTAFCSVSACF